MDNKFYMETVADYLNAEFELNCMQMDFIDELCEEFAIVTDAIGYANEIVEYGCASGIVGHLIYTHDVMHYLAENYQDIEMYIQGIGEQTDAKMYYEDFNIVDVVWEAYEAMVADTLVLMHIALDAIE